MKIITERNVAVLAVCAFGIFSIGFLKIRWYGLMYVIGFLFAWWLAKRRCKRSDSPITSEQVDDLVEEVTELNETRAKSFFHRGFVDALLGKRHPPDLLTLLAIEIIEELDESRQQIAFR